ncbi:hypothetical protein DPMN_180898 [Dreissena polymorpha]|uniref:Uncharacterized protein n=1 Tax=Dreissena polymorpha TaxID=45954 RepID=A0A9D4DDE7_DREPO|nr:hypothetical protein DPMN_180898 [Dreissena polymorpha]
MGINCNIHQRLQYHREDNTTLWGRDLKNHRLMHEDNPGLHQHRPRKILKIRWTCCWVPQFIYRSNSLFTSVSVELTCAGETRSPTHLIRQGDLSLRKEEERSVLKHLATRPGAKLIGQTLPQAEVR